MSARPGRPITTTRLEPGLACSVSVVATESMASRTSDAVTPMPGLWVPFLAFTILFAVLGVTATLLLKRHVFMAPTGSTATPARATPAPDEVS